MSDHPGGCGVAAVLRPRRLNEQSAPNVAWLAGKIEYPRAYSFKVLIRSNFFEASGSTANNRTEKGMCFIVLFLRVRIIPQDSFFHPGRLSSVG